VSKTLFLVFREPGPAWIGGWPTRRQPSWDEHALFIDRLFEQGRIIMAGPYADCSRALLIVQAGSKVEASELFRDDPWTRAGVLCESDVVEWTVFLDAHRSPKND
jgi:uncharacterized protein